MRKKWSSRYENIIRQKGISGMEKKEKIEEITSEEQSFIDEMHAQRILDISDKVWVNLYHNKNFYETYKKINNSIEFSLHGEGKYYIGKDEEGDDQYEYEDVNLLERISVIMELIDNNIKDVQYIINSGRYYMTTLDFQKDRLKHCKEYKTRLKPVWSILSKQRNDDIKRRDKYISSLAKTLQLTFDIKENDPKRFDEIYPKMKIKYADQMSKFSDYATQYAEKVQVLKEERDKIHKETVEIDRYDYTWHINEKDILGIIGDCGALVESMAEGIAEEIEYDDFSDSLQAQKK